MTALQFYRERLNITQAQFAEMLDVTQGAVSNWENGIRKPDIFMLKRIAEVLHCTTDELLAPIPTQESDKENTPNA